MACLVDSRMAVRLACLIGLGQSIALPSRLQLQGCMRLASPEWNCLQWTDRQETYSVVHPFPQVVRPCLLEVHHTLAATTEELQQEHSKPEQNRLVQMA